MSGMTSPLVARDPEAELRSYYAATDPGPAPSDFVHGVEADLIAADDRRAPTFAVERVIRQGPTAGVGVLLAACAVVAIIAIGIALSAQRTPLPSPATGASPPVVSPSAAGSVAGHPSGFPTDPAAMAFFDAEQGLVVGEVDNQTAIWRTADGGRTWTLALLDVFRGTGVTVAGTHAWATGGSWGSRLGPGVFESTDAGVTWTKVGSEELESISFVDDQHGFAIRPSSNETAIAASTDGGRTWLTLPAAAQPCGGLGTGDPHPVGLSFMSPSHGWVLCEAGFNPGGIEQRGVAETTDGGSTWQWVARVTPSTDPQITTLETPDLPGGMAMRPDGTGFIWCWGGTLLRTEDGGRSWSKVSSTPLTFTVQPWIIAAAGAAGPWFTMRPASNPVALERSDDGGRTWSVVVAGPQATTAPIPQVSS
jgi:photosystem II stability/assembly factor-like uncharacterized protein